MVKGVRPKTAWSFAGLEEIPTGDGKWAVFRSGNQEIAATKEEIEWSLAQLGDKRLPEFVRALRALEGKPLPVKKPAPAKPEERVEWGAW